MNRKSIEIANELLLEIAKVDLILKTDHGDIPDYKKDDDYEEHTNILIKLGLNFAFPGQSTPSSVIIYKINQKLGKQLVASIKKAINEYEQEIEKL